MASSFLNTAAQLWGKQVPQQGSAVSQVEKGWSLAYLLMSTILNLVNVPADIPSHYLNPMEETLDSFIVFGLVNFGKVGFP